MSAARDQPIDPTVRGRLLSLSTRPRRIHEHPLVLAPRGLEAFSNKELFGADEPGSGERILELGSGWGEFALGWLAQRPTDRYVAVESKSDRIQKTVRRADRTGTDRLRLIPVNFNWFLEEFFPPRCFDRIIVNFPDPWPKRRHWKHRLITERFPFRLENLLRPGGVVHIATDCGPYARKILAIFRRADRFASLFEFPHYRRLRPADMLATRFEEIEIALGRRPYYQAWRLQESVVTP